MIMVMVDLILVMISGEFRGVWDYDNTAAALSYLSEPSDYE